MSDIVYSLKSRPGLVALIVVGALALIGGIVAAVLFLGGDNTATAAEDDTVVETTDVVTVETLAPEAIKPAQPRPEVLPPQIAAEGTCKEAMDVQRAFMTKQPSGLALDEAGNTTLGENIAGINAECTPELAGMFQQQELFPWLNYAVPVDEVPEGVSESVEPTVESADN